jgi:hypothetical protein
MQLDSFISGSIALVVNCRNPVATHVCCLNVAGLHVLNFTFEDVQLPIAMLLLKVCLARKRAWPYQSSLFVDSRSIHLLSLLSLRLASVLVCVVLRDS